MISKNLNNNNRQNRKVTRGKGKSNNKQNRLVTKEQVANMILSSVGQVTSKYLTSSLISSVPPVTGILEQPSFPTQGVTNGEREGDSLDIEKIESTFLLENAEASIGGNNVDTIRVIVLQARSSTVLTISSISAPLTGVLDAGYSGAVDITSHINQNAKNKLFHVLHDTSYPVNFGSSNASRILNLNMRPKISRINFTPTTVNSQSGGIFYIFLTATGSAACNGVQRLVYRDL